MQNARMDEAQAEIKIARRNSNNLRYADDTTFMTKREEELKSLLMKVKEGSLSPVSPLALNLSPHHSLFQWVISLHQMAKVSELQLQHQSFQGYSGLFSFRIDWFVPLAVQRTFKNPLQHLNSKASNIYCFMVQLSHLYTTTGNAIALIIWTFVSKVISLLFNKLSRFIIAFLPSSKCL